MPQFEYDENKSNANFEKHGIDFVQAQKLWGDIWAIKFPIEYPIENRFMAIGMIDDKYWTAIFTYRNENIRLISVRRSRDGEKEIYEHGRI
jgi:uncharacterized DUF497 family protein